MAAVGVVKVVLLINVIFLLFYESGTAYRGSRYSGYRSRTYTSYRPSRSSYRTYSYYRLPTYYRYSSYRAPSTYRATRYSTYYRTRSTYTSYNSYRRSYSRSRYSSYRYNPSLVRYTRHYSSWGVSRYYYYYYRLYFYRPYQAGYYASRSTRGSVTTCKNYEANTNGTAIGVFVCPNTWEPSDFTWCCGKTNFEYCCSFWEVSGHTEAVVISSIIAVLLICGLVVCVYKVTRKPKKPLTETRRGPLLTRSRVTPQQTSNTQRAAGQLEMEPMSPPPAYNPYGPVYHDPVYASPPGTKDSPFTFNYSNPSGADSGYIPAPPSYVEKL